MASPRNQYTRWAIPIAGHNAATQKALLVHPTIPDHCSLAFDPKTQKDWIQALPAGRSVGRMFVGGPVSPWLVIWLAAFFSSSPIMCTDHATHPHPPYPRDFVIRILPGSSSSPAPVVLVTFSDHNRAHHYYHGAASPVIPSSSITSSLPWPVSRSLPTPYDQSTHLNRQPGSHLFTA
jgi:hypothetical protein